LIKSVLLNLEFLVSKTKVTLAFVDVSRRWRWFIVELAKLPPEP
jgi:hypothetical protein